MTKIRAKKIHDKIDMNYLLDRLSYDPNTGVFTRKTQGIDNFKTKMHWANWNKRYAGRPAGDTKKSGYVYIAIKCQDGVKRSFLAHRLAYYIHYGEWPDCEIDHVNGNCSDNRISNIRLATPDQNQQNVKTSVRNTSGYKGVKWVAARKGWIADIMKSGVMHRLGKFNCPTAAHFAYIRASMELHGEFSRKPYEAQP